MSRLLLIPAVLVLIVAVKFFAPQIDATSASNASNDEQTAAHGLAATTNVEPRMEGNNVGAHSNANNVAVESSTALLTAVAFQQTQNNTAGLMSNQLHGIAKPSNSADLPSLVAGIISQVHVPEGKFVRKGDPLVTLDDRVPRARLQAATIEANLTGALQRTEVELKMATSRLERIRKVLTQGAGASFEIEEAEGARDQASAAVAQQKDILKAAEANRDLA